MKIKDIKAGDCLTDGKEFYNVMYVYDAHIVVSWFDKPILMFQEQLKDCKLHSRDDVQTITEPQEVSTAHSDMSKPSNPKDAVGSTKVAMHYLPLPVVAEIALGLTEGGMKYGSHNFRIAGVRASIYFDATMRHLMSWWEGEDIDPDSGLSHITKAMSSLTVLRDAMMNDMWNDDRPPKAKNQNWVRDFNKLSKEIIDKYPDPVPPYTNNHNKLHDNK